MNYFTVTLCSVRPIEYSTYAPQLRTPFDTCKCLSPYAHVIKFHIHRHENILTLTNLRPMTWLPVVSRQNYLPCLEIFWTRCVAPGTSAAARIATNQMPKHVFSNCLSWAWTDKKARQRRSKLAYCQQLVAGGLAIRDICINMIDLCDNFRQHNANVSRI